MLRSSHQFGSACRRWTRLLGTGLLLCLLLAQVSAQTPVGTVGVPGSPADDEYTIGPEDVVQIRVWGRDDLSGSVTVDYSGGILTPLLGEMPAAGRTPADLTADLSERYRLLDPTISEVLVSVIQYNSRSVTILGEVRSPGRYGFREMPDIWDALLTAGGTTPNAELALVQIVRTQRDEQEPRILTLDLTRGIEGTSPDLLPPLRPKDQIVVSSTEGAPVGGESIFIIGAVSSPGVYRLYGANDVIAALTLSGGFLPSADLSRVYVTRATARGAVSYELDIEGYLTKASPLANMRLQAGDTVTVVERAGFWASFTSSLARLLPIVSLITTIILASNR